MKIKAMYSVALMVAVVALLVTGMPVYATTMDDRIESSARQSYVFKTYLKDDDIKIQSKDGLVTLTGIVANEFHKSLAQETLAGLPGEKVWTTGWNSKARPPPQTRMHGSGTK